MRSGVLSVSLLRVVGLGVFCTLSMACEVCSTWSRNHLSHTPLINSTRHCHCLPPNYTKPILDLEASLSGFMLHRRCWRMQRLALPTWLVCCTTENPGIPLGTHPICQRMSVCHSHDIFGPKRLMPVVSYASAESIRVWSLPKSRGSDLRGRFTYQGADVWPEFTPK